MAWLIHLALRMGSLGLDGARHGEGRVCTTAVRRSACASTGSDLDPGAGGSTCVHRAKAHLGRVRAWLGYLQGTRYGETAVRVAVERRSCSVPAAGAAYRS